MQGTGFAMQTRFFHTFCILTKKGIEILFSFVYNVLIVVVRTQW